MTWNDTIRSILIKFEMYTVMTTKTTIIMTTTYLGPLGLVCSQKTLIKVAFIQKVLMCFSYLQTDEPNYFPEHFAIWAFRAASSPYVTIFEPFGINQFQNFKMRKIIWFICWPLGDMMNAYNTFWIKATFRQFPYFTTKKPSHLQF